MATYNTPGTFVEEVSTLPPSVAPVPTSIPGFVGATEKAIIDGVQWDYGTSSDVPTPPIRIESLLEFEAIFGGPFKESYSVELTGTAPVPTNVVVQKTSTVDHILYYHVQMFYANGGGTCYVSSVEGYGANVTRTQLEGGMNNMEQIDDVTLLLAPESIFLTAADRKSVNDNMLSQCAKLQDRFALLDVLHENGNTVQEDADDFRDDDVGADNLRYGASYYPAINTVLEYAYDPFGVVITDSRTGAVYNSAPNNTLSTVKTGLVSYMRYTVSGGGLSSPETFTLDGTVLTVGVDLDPATNIAGVIASMVKGVNSHPILSQTYLCRIDPTSSTHFFIQMKESSTATPAWSTTASSIAGTAASFNPGTLGTNDTSLYNTILADLAGHRVQLYPSGTMAGIYARVDASRGVWQAPANVSIRGISGVNVTVDNQEQGNLNVDSVSGKSINVIREFAGRGTLVWGARTLAGNDNEWRYINVRRLFLFVEESIKKSTEFSVFEPNTATTWSRIQGTANSFLNNLWREGALAGAVPEDAFFVKVGLNETMTSDDILNGRLIVEIGLAAVRPAEFIVLRFSHLVQQS